MKKLLKQNIFLMMSIALLFVLLEWLTSWQLLSLMGISFALLIGSFMVPYRLLRQLMAFGGLFTMMLGITLTRSVWLLLIAFVIVLIVFRTNEGNELIGWGESLLRPFVAKQQYHGIQLVEPQSKQRALLSKKSLLEQSEFQRVYEWNDINLVYFGGDSIIDLGNTLVPERENVILVRKMFGRTRLIIPRNVGLYINMSALSGKLLFESEVYALVGENFQWASPDYDTMNRKVKMVISVIYGHVEVIVL